MNKTIADIVAFALLLAVFAAGVAAQESKCAETDHDCRIAELEKALKADKGNNEINYNLGLAHQNKGDHKKAISYYDVYLKTGGKTPQMTAEGHNNRAIAYREIGNDDPALADYNKAIELDGANPNFYVNRANLLKARGDADGAIRDYSKAIELKPDHINAYINRGVAYNDKQDRDKAIADYTKAIELDPQQTQAYYNRAVAYTAMQSFDKALPDLNKFIDSGEPPPAMLSDAYLNRGIVQYYVGDLAKAVADMTKSIELNP
ncbi:MAG TPA: tetratricopeptide repeat protein, partial [Pyrinomonadaceae bacterium]|nr:tetratricopeptide repeat protein [Pyrinomonadaceae bacterium]